jgi:hypothetical protein
VSSLEDQVERRVLRAKRAFRQSRKIITVSRDELESHRRWLDRHSAAWAEEVQRYGRLLNRKLAIRAFTRGAVGLILAPHRALAQPLRWTLNKRPSRASQLSFAETALDRPRRAQLQHSIRRLDGTKVAVLRSTPGRFETGGECSSRARALEGLRALSKRTVLVSALGYIALFLLAAGAVRATIWAQPTEAPVLVARQVPYTPQPTAEPSVTEVPKKAQKSPSGFSVLAAISSPRTLPTPAPTVADMMLITSPLALEPIESEPKTAPPALKPLASKPVVKAKPKRKFVTRERQQVPWWQQLPWIHVR